MRLDVTDNPVISGMSRIFDMMCLNVLWLVCSLPIFYDRCIYDSDVYGDAEGCKE